MRKRRKWLAALMTIAMLVTMIPAGAFAQEGETEAPALQWQTSKSKTATNLDENFESDITLSLPSAQEQLATDVVFVLDKSTSTEVEQQALDMLSDLKEQVDAVGAKVNVGVVIFNREANTDGQLHDLVTEYDTIEDDITEDISSGTNMHAGLLAAQKMMENSSTPDERQYLIFVSDGLSYMFDETPNAINSQQAATGEYAIMAGNDCWGIRHYQEGGDKFIPSDWDAYLTDVGGRLDDVQQYIQPYDNCDTDEGKQICIPRENTELPTTVDVALYKTADVFSQMVEKYHCYTILADSSAADSYPWAASFMSYLQDMSGNGEVDFTQIQNDIYYLLDAGSTIDDYMGYVEGEDGYDFDMDIADDLSNLYMTVETLEDGVLGAPEKLEATKIDGQENTYGFAPEGDGYKYELTYYPGEDDQEHFVWKTNVPVTNFERVQLHYTVKLVNPQDAIGEYGQYDENGSKNYTGLYTNDHATLTAVDTNGGERTEDFAKPTVSYKVAAEGTIEIEPADITIYTGGDSYDGVVNGSGNEIGATNNGLPTPGFYITLPEDVNDWLIENADPDDVTQVQARDENNNLLEDADGNPVMQSVVDLSKYLKFTYDYNGEQRTWELERYDANTDNNGEANDSIAYSKYIYRIKPAVVNNEEIPIRLQFTDPDLPENDPNKYQTTDDFTVNLDDLYHEYDMTIYAGDLQQDRVNAELTVDGEGTEFDAVVGSGTLTVRGVTDNDTETTKVVNEQPASKVDNVTAQVDSDTKFYINESQLEVADDKEVGLLVDSVVSDSNNTLQNAAVSEFEEITDQHDCEMNYLDLVDTSNGNAWVTASNKVTVHWPIPADATDDSEFYIVHYEGLDRNDNDALGNEDYTQELYSVEKGNLKVENGNLTFTVDSFSPFALFYTAEENDNPGGPVIPSDPDDPDPDTPDLNTDDHYSYIVGYPEDYRTGEATDDESLWPVKPQGNITRAEVATIFYRLLTNDARDENWTTSNSFTDVSADSWYNTPVSTLSAMGLIEGYEDGSFRPDNPITRAEFAAIAGRFFTDNDAIYEPGTFSDIEGAEWFADAVQAAKDHDIIGGYPDGSFKPNNPITRAEACSIVNRTTKRVPDADHLLALDEMRNWPDNADTSAWYYADMQEATNGHYYDYVLDENDEIVREEWTSERAPIDWEQVEEELEASH